MDRDPTEADLPLDRDIEVDDPPASRQLPNQLKPRFLALVWVGGAAGTGTRYLIGKTAPHAYRVPLATLTINVVGAFLLAVLLETLVRRGPDVGRRRTLRLLLGTGFLGGFTTYSALAVDTVTLVAEGLPARAVAYASLTLVVGGLASLAGIALGGRLHPRSRSACAGETP